MAGKSVDRPNTNSVQVQLSVASRALGALLGIAVGDALGWPQERRPSDHRPDVDKYRSWTRSVGGQYLRHDEIVLAGEYSDDTQLTLATARSLLRSANWWRYFALRELPQWSLFERGGGGATKQAAT